MTSIAIAVGSGAAAVIAVVLYAWWSSSQVRNAEQRAADARVHDEQTQTLLATANANLKAQTIRADYQETRANALDAELQTVADDGDPDAARGRVLSRLHAAETGSAASGGSSGPVPVVAGNPHMAGELGDDLERPGD